MCTRADRKECAHSKKKKQKNVKLEINSFRNVLVLVLDVDERVGQFEKKRFSEILDDERSASKSVETGLKLF